jgi:hypothetical protein
VRSESECTSEKAPGQFSIFGAVEEKFDADSPKLGHIKQWLKDAWRGGVIAVFFCSELLWEEFRAVQ